MIGIFNFLINKKMTRNTMENREQLSREQVDSWDLNDLRYYAISKMEDYYKDFSDKDFNEEWKDFYVLED